MRDETKGSCPKLIANPRNNTFKYMSDKSAHLHRINRPYLLALVLLSRNTHFCVPDGPETSKTCVPKFQPANDFVRSES